ncbi:hypothetical protein MCHI_002940 [Candidatus Magnetoovum chiemensis]|nr:hypothetical protein MCHI_002940 [Candidatus Magnetoovum chiemensis]
MTLASYKNKTLTLKTGSDSLDANYSNLLVNDQYLMDIFNLTQSFINRNARAMGSFGRPRRFFLNNVVEFLHHLADTSIQKSNYKAMKQFMTKAQVEQIFEEVTKKQLRNKGDKNLNTPLRRK